MPVLQAQIDMQGGMLNANDKDYRTAYSYFYEAFSILSEMQDNVNATKALKYMVLCKIMQNLGDDLPAIFNSKQVHFPFAFALFLFLNKIWVVRHSRLTCVFLHNESSGR